MVRRAKHGPVNAAKVLPPALVTALQQVAAGQHVYIPAVESPVIRRWREARRYQQLGYALPRIAEQLAIAPRAVTRLLASPPPPTSRAVAARFATPQGRALLRRIQQHVEACVLYVPVAVSKADQRRRRIAGLFIRGWTPARVAAHLQLSARHVARLYQAWKAEQEQQGRTVVPGQPLYSAEDRRREAAAREQRRRERRAAQQQREDAARQRALFGDMPVIVVSTRPVPLD
jgi:AraC-like DNA-binding protein